MYYLKYLTNGASKCYFACDLHSTEYHKMSLEAIIYLATFDIPCTCNDASAMIYLQLFACDGN